MPIVSPLTRIGNTHYPIALSSAQYQTQLQIRGGLGAEVRLLSEYHGAAAGNLEKFGARHPDAHQLGHAAEKRRAVRSNQWILPAAHELVIDGHRPR